MTKKSVTPQPVASAPVKQQMAGHSEEGAPVQMKGEPHRQFKADIRGNADNRGNPDNR